MTVKRGEKIQDVEGVPVAEFFKFVSIEHGRVSIQSGHLWGLIKRYQPKEKPAEVTLVKGVTGADAKALEKVLRQAIAALPAQDKKTAAHFKTGKGGAGKGDAVKSGAGKGGAGSGGEVIGTLGGKPVTADDLQMDGMNDGAGTSAEVHGPAHGVKRAAEGGDGAGGGKRKRKNRGKGKKGGPPS